MDGFIEFNRGLLQMPVFWQLWMMLLLTVNLVIPLFFLKRIEARYVIGCPLLSMVLFSVLTAQFGFTRILGLGHLPWVPLLIYLWKRLEQFPWSTILGKWMRALILLDAMSLLIDAIDVVRYVLGER